MIEQKKVAPILLLISLFLLSAACDRRSALTSECPEPYTLSGKLAGSLLCLQIANTSGAREKGLSGRTEMAEEQGMLFEFGTEATPSFWMKDMHFNLDLIWIKDNKIISVTKNVPAPKSPGDSLPNYYPPAPVDAVLEVNAGWSERNKIKTGDELQLQI